MSRPGTLYYNFECDERRQPRLGGEARWTDGRFQVFGGPPPVQIRVDVEKHPIPIARGQILERETRVWYDEGVELDVPAWEPMEVARAIVYVAKELLAAGGWELLIGVGGLAALALICWRPPWVCRRCRGTR